MSWQEWYHALEKPSWTPPGSTIGMIWSILYPVIAVTFAFVFMRTLQRKLPVRAAIPFAVILAANLSFTPIQFGLRDLNLAALVILIVWSSIIWMVMAIWRHHRWVALAQIPYFIWVSTATVLQLCITAWN